MKNENKKAASDEERRTRRSSQGEQKENLEQKGEVKQGVPFGETPERKMIFMLSIHHPSFLKQNQTEEIKINQLIR